MIPQDLNTFTPVTGRWLLDFGPEFAKYNFNILDFELLYDLFNVDYNHPAHDLYFGPLIRAVDQATDFDINHPHYVFKSKKAYHANRSILYSFHRFVNHIRAWIAESHKVPNIPYLIAFTVDESIPRYPSSFKLSGDPLKKNLFFLHVAKLVIFGFESIDSVAKKYNLNRLNVLLWISLYLNKGPATFLYNPIYSKLEEYDIIKCHIDLNHSIPFTCTVYNIFTINRFKRMLRRFRLSPNPPKSRKRRPKSRSHPIALKPISLKP